jgi:RNA recognition motif-containing protein
VPVRLFVGNLPYSATEADLRDLFAQIAEPARVSIPVDRETGRPRGFAFVEFSDPAHGQAAIDRFNGQPFQGRTIAVNEARPKGERPAGGPPPSSGPPRSSFGGPPMGGGGRPPRPGGIGGGPTGGERDAPRRRSQKGGKKREEGGPKGPIRERQTGRVYDVTGESDDDLEMNDVDLSGIDDFATSAPKDETDDEADN